MRLKALPILTLATHRMGLNLSICVTGIINLITVDLRAYSLKYLASIKKGENKGIFGSCPYLLELFISIS